MKIIYLSIYFRAEAVLQNIAELNPYVHVTSSSVPLNETTDLSFLEKYQVGTPFYIRCYWQIPRQIVNSIPNLTLYLNRIENFRLKDFWVIPLEDAFKRKDLRTTDRAIKSVGYSPELCGS